MTDTNAPERMFIADIPVSGGLWHKAFPAQPEAHTHYYVPWVKEAALTAAQARIAELEAATPAPREDGYSAGVRAVLRDKIASLITSDHLQLLGDFDVDLDLYRHDPECAEGAYATADAILALLPAETPAPREDGYSAGVRAAMRAVVENLDEILEFHANLSPETVEAIVARVGALMPAPALPDARAGAVEPVAWTTATQFDGRTSNSLEPVEVTWNVEELRIAAHQLHRGVTFSAFARRQFAEAVLGYIAVSAPPPTPACTATDGQASASVYRAPGLGTAADWERG